MLGVTMNKCQIYDSSMTKMYVPYTYSPNWVFLIVRGYVPRRDIGTKALLHLVTPPFSTHHCKIVVLPASLKQKRKEHKHHTWESLCIRPRSGTHHCYSHSISKN